jgi:hypothetical protein
MGRGRAIIATLAAFSAGCEDLAGPAIQGRWATQWIELIAGRASAELRLPCIRPVRLRHGLVPDATGTIRFSAQVRELYNWFDLTFDGRFQGDTLAATVTRTSAGWEPYVTTHLMTPDGDSELDSVFCLGSARAA